MVVHTVIKSRRGGGMAYAEDLKSSTERYESSNLSRATKKESNRVISKTGKTLQEMSVEFTDKKKYSRKDIAREIQNGIPRIEEEVKQYLWEDLVRAYTRGPFTMEDVAAIIWKDQ